MKPPSNCQYITIKPYSNATEDYWAPDICYQNFNFLNENNPHSQGLWYNYNYQCNTSNTEYFIKKIYQKVDYDYNQIQCPEKYLTDIIRYYVKDGYDFNCNNESSDCGGSVEKEVCNGPKTDDCSEPTDTYHINTTSFICGGCFNDINGNQNTSIQYFCQQTSTKKPYQGKLTRIIYDNNDCNNSTGMQEKSMMIDNPHEQDYVVKCNMPKSPIT